MEELKIYERQLPHWRLSDATYFVTWRLSNTQRFLEPQEKSLVVEIMKYFDKERYYLHAYVVMNDHCHALLQAKGGFALEKTLHSWKSYSAKRLQSDFGRSGQIWQYEYYDRIIRDDSEFLEKANYIMTNPIRKWPDIKHYEWVSYVES
ncbi:MAG: transposase [Deltaproteobacteria bacterium]|nr:transposase [Deltaproteobacteria bacterium]